MDNQIFSLLENEAFVKELEKTESLEDAVRLFANEGVEVTADELKSYLNSENDETLSEEQLDDVSGGCAALWLGARIIRGILNSRNRSSGGGGRGAFGGGGGGGGGR